MCGYVVRTRGQCPTGCWHAGAHCAALRRARVRPRVREHVDGRSGDVGHVLLGVCSGHVLMVQRLFRLDRSLLAHELNTWTMLQSACINARTPEMLEILCQHALRIADMRNDSSILHALAQAADKEGHIRLLHNYGSGDIINYRDRSGATALLLACDPCMVGNIGAFLDTGNCDTNVADKNGRTPLILCAMDGRTSIIRLLVAYGCKVDETQLYKGKNAQQWAEEGKHDECAKFLRDLHNALMHCLV